MSNAVLTVGKIALYLRNLLANDPFMSDLWVEGEVTEAKAYPSGHLYFTLKDGDDVLKAVLFRREALMQRHLPRVGERFVVHGRIDVYGRSSVYQIIADSVQPAGLGMEALEFERLRQRLEAEGLFDESRKRPLPPAPQYIGVVTSLEGAVWHDIQNVMRRRYPLAHLIVVSSPVQGPKAPAGVMRALERLQADGRAEVIIIARGGGSAEDLACFNDEALARTVYASKVPVVSAIGHETDWTILDLVADHRAPTPSAAAELCTPSIDVMRERLNIAATASRQRIVESMLDRRSSLREAKRAMASRIPAIELFRDHIEHAQVTAQRSLVYTLERHRVTLAYADRALDKRRLTERAAQRRRQWTMLEGALAGMRSTYLERRWSDLGQHRSGLARNASTALTAAKFRRERSQIGLELLSPLAVLQRGYAIVHRLDDDTPVTAASSLLAGQRIVARFADGAAGARVESVGIDGGTDT